MIAIELNGYCYYYAQTYDMLDIAGPKVNF